MGVVTDPIADMLTRIRNALAVDHSTVSMPASKTKSAIAGILKSEGFISDFEVVKSEPQDTLRLLLRYEEEGKPMIRGLKRLSKPGLRVYISKDEIPRVYGGVGITVVSTSKGMMTGSRAWRQKVGGELMFQVW
jgi:small subunit ribosomal protein S8